MRTKDEYKLNTPTWCRGCGIYGVFEALKRAAAAQDLDPEQVVLITGIGCHGRLNNYFKAYGFHGLHGRTMPVATGVKLTNPHLNVIAVSGDGDAYSIGLGHFLHALRKNIGILYLVVNNGVYALTLGQTSPTSPQGFVSISTPFGAKEYPIDGLELALTAGGTFIARGFSGEVGHMASLIEKGLVHKGFALIDVFCPCVTHNKINTYEWFKKNIYLLEEETGYNPEDKKMALERLASRDKLPVGLIYLEDKPAFEDLVLPDKRKPIGPAGLGVDAPRLEKIMEKFG